MYVSYLSAHLCLIIQMMSFMFAFHIICTFISVSTAQIFSKIMAFLAFFAQQKHFFLALFKDSLLANKTNKFI